MVQKESEEVKYAQFAVITSSARKTRVLILAPILAPRVSPRNRVFAQIRSPDFGHMHQGVEGESRVFARDLISWVLRLAPRVLHEK